MNVSKRYCDCCLKEIDTRQEPCMHSNGDNRNFIILKRNICQSKMVSDIVVKPSSSDDLFNNIDLCDKCYDKIATYIYSMLYYMEKEKSEIHQEPPYEILTKNFVFPFDDDSQPEKPIVTCDIFGQDVEVMR